MKVRKLQMGVAVAMLWAQIGLAQISLGPYVQRVATDRATVVWYTNDSTPGVLKYGTTSGQWLGSVNVPAGTVHAAEATGLKPKTKYFYEVSDGTTTLATGDDFYFETHIPAGARTPFSFIAVGDLADGSSYQKDVAARMIIERPKHEFALFLGDIVYSSGTRNEYLKYYFPVYKDLHRNFCIFPTLGNHDIKTSKAAPYFEFFYTPTNNPDGVENYYSFDYANAHIICLDDELLVSGAALTKQLDWLRKDLADAKARGQHWLVTMFHRPPYTYGTHTDDDFTKSTFVPELEKAGVDLVLCGHSHVAERSFLLNNNKIINQDLSYYPKDGASPGTVYVVAGSGGKNDNLDGNHKLMAFKQGKAAGFEIVYINGDTVRGKYMKRDGSVVDIFTMTKKGNVSHVEITDPAQRPMQFVLNYPNPFRPRQALEGLNIVFEMSQVQPVRAAVYDLTGREVARLSNGELLGPGRHILKWNGKGQNGESVANGAYFYRLQAGVQVHTAKILLLP
jgi:hypothetical protein